MAGKALDWLAVDETCKVTAEFVKARYGATCAYCGVAYEGSINGKPVMTNGYLDIQCPSCKKWLSGQGSGKGPAH